MTLGFASLINQEKQKILKKDNSCRWPTWVEERGLKFLKNNQHERTLKFGIFGKSRNWLACIKLEDFLRSTGQLWEFLTFFLDWQVKKNYFC